MPLMAQKKPIPLALTAAGSRSPAASIERLVNMYAEKNGQGAATPFSLIPTPGLKLRWNLGGGSPIRGMCKMKDRLFVVTDTEFFEIVGDLITTRGRVNIAGWASMANNGVDVMFTDGHRQYKYADEYGLKETTFDETNYPSLTCDSLDGHFLFGRKNTRQFYWSELNKADFNGLDFASAESTPDDLQQVLVNHREIWLFKKEACEIWYNTGNSLSLFERLQGAYMEKGVPGPWCAAKADNTVFWLCNDFSIYMAQGYQPQRISTSWQEYLLENADTLEDAWSMAYHQEGHIFYLLTIPALNMTWCYDTTTGLWHIRTTEGRQWDGRYIVSLGGRDYVGSATGPYIYELDMDYPLDAKDMREIVFPPIFGNGQRLRMGIMEILAQNESNNDWTPAALTPPPAFSSGRLWRDETCEERLKPKFYRRTGGFGSWGLPWMGLSWSDDQGKTWSREDRKEAQIPGKKDMRWQWTKLGSFFNRTYRIRMPGNSIQPIIGAFATFG